jgi:hypothetical protein
MTTSGNVFRKHLPFLVFYVSFLVLGLFIYKDYGISWDESACRTEIAIPNYKFILNDDYAALIGNEAKYHGPAFELLLFPLEKMFGLKDMRDIFFMRHLVTFLLFTLSVFFFYLLGKKHFKSNALALAGCIFLVLSPRIFADAFYNVKDLAFLSVVIISLYTTVRFLEKKSYPSAIVHALVSALVVDIRIMGIIVPLFTLFFLFLNFLQDAGGRRRILSNTLVFLVVLIPSIILFWPVLWHDPVGNFIAAFRESSKFPWIGYVLFDGKDYNAFELPWHYIPYWLLITTPVMYTVFFVAGLVTLLIKFFRNLKLEVAEWLNLYVFFVPVASVILLHAVLYDGWRHLYYIYPSFIFIATAGLQVLIRLIRSPGLTKAFLAGVAVWCIFVIMSMARLHPYQNLYFNFLGGKSLKDIKGKFELDYWCLSYRDGIGYILRTDTSSTINVYCTELMPGVDNAKLFSEKDRARLSFTASPEMGDYFVTAYRYLRGPFRGTPAYNLVCDGAVILSVYNTKETKFKFPDDKYLVARFFNSYEGQSSGLSDGNKIEMQDAYSGNHVEMFDPATEFGANFLFHPPPIMTEPARTRKYIKVSYQIRTPEEYNFKIILQLDSGADKTYKWIDTNMQSTLKDQWVRKEYNAILEGIPTTGERIKFFFWNPNKSKFFIDDLQISLYAIPDEEANPLLSRLP